MEIITLLTLINLIFLIAAVVFIYECIHEQEFRALKFGIAGAVFHIVVGLFIIIVPALRIPILCMFGLFVLIGICFLLPGRIRKFKGVAEYIKGDVKRFDERNTVFARDALSKEKGPEAKEIYDRYYSNHPEFEERDSERRGPGNGIYDRLSMIDNYLPNVSASRACTRLSLYLRPHVEKEPRQYIEAKTHDIEKSTERIKKQSLHWGADLVGICNTDPRWIYSHMGDVFDIWEEWGAEVSGILPNAIVIATEENYELLGSAPHSPSGTETQFGYVKCAVISSLIADWLSGMGYHAKVHYFGYNEALLVPLAVEAGLGEMGRFGYLIADKFGSRVRLAAVTTDIPLIPDKPKYLGVDEFCKHCKKCADTCPGKAIPDGEKDAHNGIDRWKLDEDRCFEYWYKAGSGCSICTSICVFGRPNRSIHKIIKWMLPRSYLARNLLPYIDNFIYGKKWKPKKVPEWIDYNG